MFLKRRLGKGRTPEETYLITSECFNVLAALITQLFSPMINLFIANFNIAPFSQFCIFCYFALYFYERKVNITSPYSRPPAYWRVEAIIWVLVSSFIYAYIFTKENETAYIFHFNIFALFILGWILISSIYYILSRRFVDVTCCISLFLFLLNYDKPVTQLLLCCANLQFIWGIVPLIETLKARYYESAKSNVIHSSLSNLIDF